MQKLTDYILPFRVDYAILQTGYTDELRDAKKIQKLFAKCENLDMVPLYECSFVNCSKEKFADTVDNDEYETAKQIVNKLVREKGEKLKDEDRGYLVVSCNENLDSVMSLYHVLVNMNYCEMYGIASLRYYDITTEDNNYKVAVLIADSEAG